MMKFKVIIMTSLLLSGVCWFLIINSIANRLYTRNLIEAIDESNYDRLEELLDKNGNIDAKPYNNFHAFFFGDL